MPPFDPADFLRVAAILGDQGANEAMLRTAVGRAYYAMFLIARDKLGVVTTEKVHSEVIRLLTRRDKKLGDQMFYLYVLPVELAACGGLPDDAREAEQPGLAEQLDQGAGRCGFHPEEAGKDIGTER